ncbi:hypothetical protein BJX99DRAFT_237408 [Aspergillus californicus]
MLRRSFQRVPPFRSSSIRYVSSTFKPDVHPPQLAMPGFNLPLNHPPDVRYDERAYAARYKIDRKGICGFPNALDADDLNYGSLSQIVTYREILMMRVVNSITDKPDWERKVFDKDIVAKWREEVTRSGEDVSEKMMDWIIKEMQWKAGISQNTQSVQVFDDGVVKSDTAISKELQAALKEAVAPLERHRDRDYHPGSDQRVVNLVHPSLFPVIYGRTRVLPDRVLGLEDSLQSMGEGDLLPVPEEDSCSTPQRRGYGYQGLHLNPFSPRFQWLPCDVDYNNDGTCRIRSYINNAHPVKHRALYKVLERILPRTFPLWEKSLTKKEYDGERIPYKQVVYEDPEEPEPEYPEDCTPDEEEMHHERYEEWLSSRRITQPEPGEFKVPKIKDLKFLEHFAGQQYQVIVKLANIELTPEKPNYEGGTWHIEGQLNERIAASAIYYYDSSNITSSALAFRHRAVEHYFDGLDYEQGQHQFLQHVYGFPDSVDGCNHSNLTQDLGSVLCKEGRLITFPNTLQHRVLPFSLADSSKPGHRKILALFLVDPHRRIISSANVPPQREDWRLNHATASEQREDAVGNTKIPSSTMTMEEAKTYRLELMEERGLRAEEYNTSYEEGCFNLCEH